MKLAVLGFSILTFFAVMLIFSGLLVAVNISVLISILISLIIIGLVFSQKNEWISNVYNNKEIFVLEKQDLLNFLAVVGGTVITFILSNNLQLGAVVASSIVGIAATLIIPRYDVPTFCGSFVGMASITLLTTYFCVFLAGIIAGIVFVITKQVFNGFGGKLGTIAFIGCVFAALITRNSFLTDAVPNWQTGRLMIIYAVLGAVLTFIVSERLNHSAVISSGLIGVFAGLILPVVYPEIGVSLGVVVFCASFAGMSSLDRVHNELQMAIAGLFCGIIFMYTAPYLGGAGGKLGTIAFISVISINGLNTIVTSLSNMPAFSFLQNLVKKTSPRVKWIEGSGKGRLK